jgi:hypothetical protein
MTTHELEACVSTQAVYAAAANDLAELLDSKTTSMSLAKRVAELTAFRGVPTKYIAVTMMPQQELDSFIENTQFVLSLPHISLLCVRIVSFLVRCTAMDEAIKVVGKRNDGTPIVDIKPWFAKAMRMAWSRHNGKAGLLENVTNLAYSMFVRRRDGTVRVPQGPGRPSRDLVFVFNREPAPKEVGAWLDITYDPNEPPMFYNLPRGEDEVCSDADRADYRALVASLRHGRAALRVCGCCEKVEAGAMRLLKCAACKLVHYCDAACQKQDWVRHRPVCRSATHHNK